MSLFLKDSPQEMRVEMLPDAWKRFHGAVHTMTKAPPQHRIGIDKPKDVAGKIRRRSANKVYRHQ